jgi:TolB-like protein/DNA-binding winged helix-turn-helix (wHTH) protein/Flp pilus assembly protein TadD
MFRGKSPSVSRFDSFELDFRAGELRRNGIRLRLHGQPIQVLAALLNRSGELVTREELRAEVWTEDTFVDFDHSLHNAIARIREVLGDSASDPRYIETLPRRGYRFIGKVESVAPEDTTVPGVPEQVVPLPIRHNSGRLRAAIAITTLTLVAGGLALWLPHRTSAALPLRSIAVLPLDNLSGDASQELFVDGMMDELITNLAKVSSLRVISRTSVMRYKGTKKRLPEIARELNVDGIIEGSVMRSGGRVRITAQLLHGPTDRHLWADTYDRDVGDVLKLQREVAEAIAMQVRAQLPAAQQAHLPTVRSVNPEAYDAYLRGRYYMTTEFTKPQQLLKAQRYFRESIAKDPGFALAYSGLADSYTYLAIFRYLAPRSAYQSAQQAIHQALELDDNIGEAHDTLGVLSWRFERDFAAAEREFNHAIALDPSYSCAHEDNSLYLGLLGRRSEALAELTRSKELDPGPSSVMTESGTYYQLRDYARLLEVSREGVRANPTEWVEHYYLGIGYEATGKPLEAISEYQKAVEISGGDQDPIASLAHAYAALGKNAEAQKILRDLEQRSANMYVSPYLLATIYAGLDEKDRAFEFLEKAFEERSLDMSWYWNADMRIDNLRADPRFAELSRRSGVPARLITPIDSQMSAAKFNRALANWSMPASDCRTAGYASSGRPGCQDFGLVRP